MSIIPGITEMAVTVVMNKKNNTLTLEMKNLPEVVQDGGAEWPICLLCAFTVTLAKQHKIRPENIIEMSLLLDKSQKETYSSSDEGNN